MHKPYVLIVTLGQRDVQVVDGKAQRRFEVHKDDQRRFHEGSLAAEGAKYRVLPFAEARALRRAPLAMCYNADQRKLVTDLSDRDDLQAQYAEIDCSDGIVVCTPIIADLDTHLDRLRTDNRLGKLEHVLLLTTCRSAERNPQEPVAAGKVVQSALANAYQLPDDHIDVVVYLGADDEQLNETDKTGQTHLCRAAARRIDDSIHELQRRYPKALGVIEDVGGMPGVAEVVATSSRYRFAEVQFIRPTERPDEADRGKLVLVPPAESLETRRRVAALIRRGGLQAAAQLVWDEQGQRSVRAEPWRRWLWIASQLLNGELPDDDELPAESRIAAAVRSLLQAGPVVLSAVRVEDALRRRDWTVALRETFSFYEAAESTILDRAIRKGGESCFNWLRQDIKWRFVKDEVREAVKKEASSTLCEAISCLKRTSLGNKEYCETAVGILRRHVPEEHCESLDNLFNAVNKARPYRNATTHAPILPKEVHHVRQLLLESQVWAKHAPRFLASPPVTAVFECLGLARTEAGNLYQALIDGIIADMDRFSLNATE